MALRISAASADAAVRRLLSVGGFPWFSRIRPGIALVALGLLALGAGCSAWASSAAQGAATACLDLPLSERLGWPRAGAWVTAGDRRELLVLDVGQDPPRDLVLVAADGTVQPARERFPALAALQQPFLVRSAGSNVYIEDRAHYEILTYDNALNRIVDRKRYADRPVGDGWQLGALRDWIPVAGQGDFVAFADIYRQEGGRKNWRSALVRFGWEGPGRIFDSLKADSSQRYQFVASRDYLAEVAGSVVVLDLTRVTSLWRLPAAATAFSAFAAVPAEFRVQPDLEGSPEWFRIDPNREGAGRYRSYVYHRILEDTTTARGIFAWKGQLFLLAKGQAADNGETPWWLVRVDAATGAEGPRYQLPSRATHLTVIPGERWALLERGAVMPSGPFNAPSFEGYGLRLVPASWIENPASAPMDTRRSPACQPSPR